MDTFVLRIWTPADATGATEVASGAHGTAQHVGSGRSGIFRNDAQLLRLLDELRRAAAADPDPDDLPTR
jgi:hypothetical protein